MEVNVVQVQALEERDAREKQHQEGHYFSCNKQGHLKKDCPCNNRKGGALAPYSSSTMRAAHTKKLDKFEGEASSNKTS